MSRDIRLEVRGENHSAPIPFAARLAASDQFDTLFKDGMALVERTALYLDGPGRKDAKGLSPSGTVLYATESMRLTTRLLDLASWLLIRRALKQGDITEGEVRMKRQSVKLQALGRPSHTMGFEALPDGLRGLVNESFVMLDRVVTLDRALSPCAAASAAAEKSNPVGAQILQLNKAFAR